MGKCLFLDIHLKLGKQLMHKSRQTLRTRAAILAAFSGLVFSRRYDEIRMIDIARDANIGRSTLYLHYQDKDAILLDNMSPLLDVLAGAVFGKSAVPKVKTVLDHIWSHRDRGRTVLFGITGQKLEAALAKKLAKNISGAETVTAQSFIVNPISAMIFAILRTWLNGEASGTRPDIALHICNLSYASLTTSQAMD